MGKFPVRDVLRGIYLILPFAKLGVLVGTKPISPTYFDIEMVVLEFTKTKYKLMKL
jgi:hypothetical protein